MSIAESFLPEFDMEMANTRKVLERVPGLGLLEGVGIESTTADRGQERWRHAGYDRPVQEPNCLAIRLAHPDPPRH